MLINLAHTPHVAMVVTVTDKRRHRHLRARHVEPACGIFHVHHPVVITAWHNPADAQPRCDGFGKRAAQQHAAINVHRVNGARARVFCRQLAVDIIFNNHNVVPLGEG